MSLIKAFINPVTPFQQNAPILFCEESKNDEIPVFAFTYWHTSS